MGTDTRLPDLSRRDTDGKEGGTKSFQNLHLLIRINRKPLRTQTKDRKSKEKQKGE